MIIVQQTFGLMKKEIVVIGNHLLKEIKMVKQKPSIKVQENRNQLYMITCIVLLILNVFQFGMLLSIVADKPIFQSYQNCSCKKGCVETGWDVEPKDYEQKNLTYEEWESIEKYLEEKFKTFNYNYSDCTEIPCECHKWGCALYCMECEE